MPLPVNVRYLITTADERSWKLDRPVLFLGEWCRRYDRREVWSSLDAEVAVPFGIAPGEKVRDVERVRQIAAGMLPEVGSALNEFHGEDHSTRYWEIVLGHWLLRYVSVMFNRYHTIALALRDYRLSGTTVFASQACALATTNSTEFVWACNDDVWNNVLYGRILDFMGAEIQQQRIEPAAGGVSRFRQPTASRDAHGGVKQRIRAATAYVLPRLSRSDDAVLISTYLPLGQRLKLELSLGQVPQVRRTPPLLVAEPDTSDRTRLKFDIFQHDGFDRFLRIRLGELIPSCYLEGYALLRAQAASLGWPSSPEFIYTANNFDSDEIFKVWTAGRVEHGVPYVTGQHGNNYGTHIWAGTEFWPERSASDRFVTWGWTDDDQRDVPAFLFRTAGRAPQSGKQDGGLLLIEMPISHRIDPSDRHAEFATYQEEQFRFVELLPDVISDVLTVRLHAEYSKFPWGEKERWHDRQPDTRVEFGRVPLKRLIDENRLVVHSYDSTGILETLALDTPTMCFWNGGFDHLLPTAKPCYELLREAGILHDTAEAAAAAVTAHWEDISGWWRSVPVQHARRLFCARYARTDPHPVRTLRSLLRGTRARSR